MIFWFQNGGFFKMVVFSKWWFDQVRTQLTDCWKGWGDILHFKLVLMKLTWMVCLLLGDCYVVYYIMLH